MREPFKKMKNTRKASSRSSSRQQKNASNAKKRRGRPRHKLRRRDESG